MKGATLDVVAVNGQYAAAILHRGNTVSHRSLTLSNGRWYDGEHGKAACAPEIYEMPGAYPPPATWASNGYAGYFDDARQGSASDGTIGRDATTLIIGISDSTVIKGAMGGGYWIVLAIDVRQPGVYCAYDDRRRLVHHAGSGWFAAGGMPGYTGPTEPPPAPSECPRQAPAV
jgi:hypothetical protein